MTVNKVLSELARAGLILRRRKTGSVIKRQDTRTAILAIYDVADEVRALGLNYSFKILEQKQCKPAPQETALNDFDPDQLILSVTVVHLADDEPFCLEERIINLASAPTAADADFSQQTPGAWLLNHVPWTTGEHQISAETDNARIAKLLNVAKGSAVLVVQRQTWKQNKPVTRVRLNYPGHQHRLTADFTPLSGLRPTS